MTSDEALTADRLVERWKTDRGKSVREQVLQLIRSNLKWEDSLTDLEGCDEVPNRSDLRGIDLSGESLEDAELTYACLDFAKFDECNLARANFHGSRLHFASFVRAGLPLASLVQTDVDSANFEAAEMVGCKMMASKFERCNFRGTNLSWAVATGSVFSQCVFIANTFKMVLDDPEVLAIRGDKLQMGDPLILGTNKTNDVNNHDRAVEFALEEAKREAEVRAVELALEARKALESRRAFVLALEEAIIKKLEIRPTSLKKVERQLPSAQDESQK